jgi:phage-related protein (TIGR01555 family)
MSYNELDNIYRQNWMARRIVDVPNADATRKGREFVYDDPDVVKKRGRADRVLGTMSVVREAMQWADLYGGSAIIFGMDGVEDEAEPWDISTIKKGDLKFMHVVIKDQLNPSDEIELDPLQPNYRKSKYYTLSNAPTVQRIHGSRVILFTGSELAVYAATEQYGWGDSVLTKALNILNMSESTWLNIAQLIEKALVDVYGVEDYLQLACKAPGQLSQLVASQNDFESNYRRVIMDREDTFNRHELGGLQGMADVMVTFLQLVAGAAGMPLSKFLGTSVGGFATGENEIIDYYDTVRDKQNRIFKQLNRLDKIIEMSTFGDVLNIDFDWVTLQENTQKEEAEIQSMRAARDASYLAAGVLTPDIVAHQLREDGTYNAIDAEYIKELEDVVEEEGYTDHEDVREDIVVNSSHG